MNTLNDSGAGDQVKQGKYANALILILMSLLGVVASYFSYQIGQQRKEYKMSLETARAIDQRQRVREDSIRSIYQAKLDQREDYHERKYNLLQTKIDSIRDNIVAEAKMGRAKSEVLASQSKKVVNSIRDEVKKTTDAAKEFDSVSKSLSQ